MKLGAHAVSVFLLASRDALSSTAFRPSILSIGRKTRPQRFDPLPKCSALDTLRRLDTNKREGSSLAVSATATAVSNSGGHSSLSPRYHLSSRYAWLLSSRGGGGGVGRSRSSSNVDRCSSTALNSAVAQQAETAAPVEIFRKDYKPLPHTVSKIHMDFVIREGKTTVTSELHIQPNPAISNPSAEDLVLDGDETSVKLLSLSMDGRDLEEGTDYTIAPGKLVIKSPKPGSVLKTVVEIIPEQNTQLSGLYKSGPMYCTQCEAMGFRRITYYPDRPDNMAVFEKVRLEADEAEYPVLLANGNLIESGKVGNGRHYAIWSDPFPKPSYLFCCVAGNLGSIQDKFTTTSGRQVQLQLFSEKENVGKLQYAMESLKRSMKWDEDRYGLEYDLDLYNIVAVDSFNMGAMENKVRRNTYLMDAYLSSYLSSFLIPD